MVYLKLYTVAYLSEYEKRLIFVCLFVCLFVGIDLFVGFLILCEIGNLLMDGWGWVCVLRCAVGVEWGFSVLHFMRFLSAHVDENLLEYFSSSMTVFEPIPSIILFLPP